MAINLVDRSKSVLERRQYIKKHESVIFFCCGIDYILFSQFHPFSLSIENDNDNQLICFSLKNLDTVTTWTTPLRFYNKSDSFVVAKPDHLGHQVESFYFCQFFLTSNPTYSSSEYFVLSFARIDRRTVCVK